MNTATEFHIEAQEQAEDCRRICDRCNNFEVSRDGTRETCHARRIGSALIAHMPADYIEARMQGEKQNCKEFKKIQTHY
jgi:hypothetical protein